MPEPTAIQYRFSGIDSKDQPEFKVTYKDVYSWQYFYTLLHEWLLDQKYCGADEDFKEILYEHIERPNGAEIWVRWRLEKSDGVAAYPGLFKYELDIDMRISGQKEVEVVAGGKKYKADKGEIEIACNGRVIRDPKGLISKHWLGKHFKDFIFNIFLKPKAKQNEKALFGDMQRLQEAIKAYLKLETYLPERELSEFWQKRDQT